MARFSAPALFGAGLLAVAAVGGATFGVATYLDLGDDSTAGAGAAPTSTSTPEGEPERVLGEGQTEITGTATFLQFTQIPFEPLALPLTITTPERGNGAGAFLTDVVVDGRPAAITWDAGRPFVLGAGPGALQVSTVGAQLADGTFRVTFADGEVHGFADGAYTLTTPVGVDFGDGLLEARDVVTFTASAQSAISFRGGASTDLPPGPRTFLGPGRIGLRGTLELRRPGLSGPVPAQDVALEQGEFEVEVTPVPGGLQVVALLEGDVQLIG